MKDSERDPVVGDYVSCLFGTSWFMGYVSVVSDVQEPDKKTKKMKAVKKMTVFFPDDGNKHVWDVSCRAVWKFSEPDSVFIASVQTRLEEMKKKKTKSKRAPRSKAATKKKAPAKAKPKPKQKAPAKPKAKPKKKHKRSFEPEDRRRIAPPTAAELAQQRTTPPKKTKKQPAAESKEPPASPPRGFYGNEGTPPPLTLSLTRRPRRCHWCPRLQTIRGVKLGFRDPQPQARRSLQRKRHLFQRRRLRR